MLGLSLVASGGLITRVAGSTQERAADLGEWHRNRRDWPPSVSYTLSWGWVAVSIAGVPYGIWLGMTSAVVFMGSVCRRDRDPGGGNAARRHGHVRSTIGPYSELMSPSILAVVFANSTLFRLATVGLGERLWHPIMVPLLVLAVISVLARWPWYVRALLHVGMDGEPMHVRDHVRRQITSRIEGG